MRFMITGGAGFIGSHLAATLAAEGHDLFILDNLSTGKRANVPLGARLIEDDIARDDVFDLIIKNVDACFHLAAVASVERSCLEWRHTHQVNLGGTVNLFDAIARSGRKIPVVYASSAAVYGASDAQPLTESGPTLPLSAYGVDKLACEFHGWVGQHIHSIPNIGLRFFNVYGPRQDPSSPYSGVITIFGTRLQNNQPLIINGDGKQSRDFIYVDDIVYGLKLAMDKLMSNAMVWGVFNLCTGKATTIETLAQTMCATAGQKAKIEHGPARIGDARHAIGNPVQAASALGFIGQTSLETGLRHTLEWMKNAA